ncbi:arsenate-mycothiol transferase [Arthrobacter sp. UYCu723]
MDSAKTLPVAVIGAGPVGLAAAARPGQNPGRLTHKGNNALMTQETSDAHKTPAVLFVCSKNGGKSQLAAGLMNQLAGGAVMVYSAGTKPGKSLNPQAVESLTELGIDITGEHPKPVTEEVLAAVDAVIILGTEAKLQPHEGTRFEVWETDEPSERGIEGMERMRLVRDDIKARVEKLYAELTGN